MPDPDRRAADAVDAALLARLAAGDEDAFVELYRRRQPDVYRFAFAMARSAAVAQDVAQDVFMALLQDAVRFDPSKGSVRAWLFGRARHAVLDRLRRDSRLTGELPEEAVACAGEANVLAAQRLERLHAAIVELPFDYREAIVLCELVELSYAECAQVLGCPIGTIRSRLHRAKALLAIRLADLHPAAAAVQMGPAAQAASAAPAQDMLMTTNEVCS